ncbi:MAG TPA: disulfide oxidoreductase [Dehalococcoidia bacterium]|nr:disulfide oxidoreductase [Dehalococcoidia bacterium]
MATDIITNEPLPLAERIKPFLARYGPALAFVMAATATLGSLYYSEIRDFIPCDLCWFQRILMYPLAAILLVGFIRFDRWVPAYVLPLATVGFGFSTYHYYVQNAEIHASGFCRVGASCSVKWVNYFGFVTIPFMAQVAFALIIIVMLATVWAVAHSEDEHDYED